MKLPDNLKELLEARQNEARRDLNKGANGDELLKIQYI